VCGGLSAGDQLLCSGRSIGPALARGLEPRAVLAELLGKAAGPCRGRAGRGHLSQPSAGLFGAHAVVGGNLSVAAGVALAAQMQGEGRIVACLFGDGACGPGAVHETLNFAALWKLPLVLVCNNNGYSVSTPVGEVLTPRRLADLAGPFGVPGRTVDGMDVRVVRDAFAAMAARARDGAGPSFLECLSYRFRPHSTATRESRPAEEVRGWRERCPIRVFIETLRDSGTLSEAALQSLHEEVAALVEMAVRYAVDAPEPGPEEGMGDVG
jgi:pyruvate dehydrogenase E1 component alpha subunit